MRRTGRAAEKRRFSVRSPFLLRTDRSSGRKLWLASGAVLGLLHLVFSASLPTFTISPTTISFPDRDPDAYPEVPASGGLNITIRATDLKAGETWRLELSAASDLTSGSSAIPISNVRWTISGAATPPGSFFNGTLSRNVFQSAGFGPGGSGNKQADVTASAQFYLKNSWAYAPGTYTSLVDVRVTVPGGVKTLSATLTITISSRLSLTLGMSSINFPAADPDLVPSIAASENPVSVGVNVQIPSATSSTLTCLASSDLISGSDAIPAANVSWTATGTGFLSGTMSRTSPRPAGQWAGMGSWSGTFSFRLANAWTYSVGAYATTVVYTFTAL
jgi:hypothetical protein